MLISLFIILNPYKKRNLKANNLKSILLNREKVTPRKNVFTKFIKQNTKV